MRSPDALTYRLDYAIATLKVKGVSCLYIHRLVFKLPMRMVASTGLLS